MFLRCSRSILLVWFAKGSVFLEGFKVTTFVCCAFLIWFNVLSQLDSYDGFIYIISLNQKKLSKTSFK